MSDHNRTMSLPELTVKGAPRLVGWTDNVKGQLVSLARERTLLGSASTATVHLDDPLVSRKHAEIVRLPDGHYSVRDLNSKNGTRVNNLRLNPEQPAMLRHGDYLFFAQQGFRFDSGAGLKGVGSLLARGLCVVAVLLALVAAIRLWLVHASHAS